MKISKKIILISTVSLLLLGSVSVGGYAYYKKSEETKRVALEEVQREAQRKEAEAKAAVDEIKKELEDMKAKEPEKVKELVKEVIKETPVVSKSANASSLVRQWEDNTLFVMCFMLDADYEPYDIYRGSGFLTEYEGQYYVYTNRHLLTNEYGESNDGCLAVSSELDDIMISSDLRGTRNNDNRDFGYFIPEELSEKAKLVARSGKVCKVDPEIGEDVLILGYPAMGAEESITVTQGIISGFDKDYFVTSTKIDQGNSGGVAISVEDNCYLGIPTFALTGEIESFARILDIKSVIN